MSDPTFYLRQETARLQEENRQLREEVQSLRQYAEGVQSLVDLVGAWDPHSEVMPLLDRILYNALSVLDAKDGSLLVLDDETNELVFVLVRGVVDENELHGVRIPPGAGIAGWVAKHAKPAIVDNPRKDPRFLASIDEKFDFRTESLLAAPIIGGGRVMGVIETLNKHTGEPFNQADLTLLTLLCHFAGEVLDRLVTETNGKQEKAARKPSKAKPSKAKASKEKTSKEKTSKAKASKAKPSKGKK